MGVMDFLQPDPHQIAAFQRLFLFRLRRLVQLRQDCDCVNEAGRAYPVTAALLNWAIYSTVMDCRDLGCGGEAAVLLSQVHGGKQ